MGTAYKIAQIAGYLMPTIIAFITLVAFFARSHAQSDYIVKKLDSKLDRDVYFADHRALMRELNQIQNSLNNLGKKIDDVIKLDGFGKHSENV